MITDSIRNLIKKHFEGQLEESERAELSSWIENAENQPDLKKALEELWVVYSPEETMPVNMSERMISRFFKEEGVRNKEGTIYRQMNHRARRWQWIAASVALLAIASYFFLAPSASTDNRLHTVSTQKGSKSRMQLPDGTTVWLNAGSKIEYDESFGKTTRYVKLEGEAYFDVTHDKKRPFLIHTAALDIKVLGTVFNVRAYPDEKTTEASLVKGSIEVSFPGSVTDKIVLSPSEKISVENSAPVPVKKAATKDSTAPIPSLVVVSKISYQQSDNSIIETSWVDNKLVFRNRPFEEIIAEMSRWYGVNFEMNNKTMTGKRFTATFQNETVHEALLHLSSSLQFSYSIDSVSNTIIIQ